MMLILQSEKHNKGLVNFELPEYTFDDNCDLEFRIIDCFIGFNQLDIKYGKHILDRTTMFLSVQSNLIDRSPLNLNQDLFFMSSPITSDHVHYQPTSAVSHKMKVYDLSDLLIKINSRETVIERINFISLQIEILSYGRIQ